MDADFSHDPKYLPEFLQAIERADLVVGSRYRSGVNVINWPISRLLLSLGANEYARRITGLAADGLDRRLQVLSQEGA